MGTSQVIYPRRSVPSVSGLIAFEATGRHLSFSRAAEELALTQGAVSKRVRQLETVLGLQLLLRSTNQVHLTESGKSYLIRARDLLRQLHMSTEDVRAVARGGETVRIAAPTDFASRWLVPRLTGFLEAFPQCSVNVVSAASLNEAHLGQVECIICEGEREGPWRDAHRKVLASGPNVVVASADYLQGVNHITPRLLDGMPLLVCNREPDLWQQWFAKFGLMMDQPVNEIRFDDMAVIVEATLAGHGFSLLPEFLVAEEVRSGRLRIFFPESGLGLVQYKLAIQHGRAQLPSVQNLVHWLANPTRNTTLRKHDTAKQSSRPQLA